MLMLAAALALLLAAPTSSPKPTAEISLAACLGREIHPDAIPRVERVRAELSASAWAEACRQAREADARHQSVVRTILATGTSPVGGYASAVGEMRLAQRARDPVVAELFRRTARDQAERRSLSFTDGKRYGAGLSPHAWTLLDVLVSLDATATDADNRQWLKQTVAERGWFTISRDGPEADSSAWLIVQHGDMDPEFQRSMIALLEPLARRGETSRRRLAYLYDRWAQNAAQPQRFGIMGRCVSPGVWEPRTITDERSVDARRRDAGLTGTLAEHRAAMNETCR